MIGEFDEKKNKYFKFNFIFFFFYNYDKII